MSSYIQFYEQEPYNLRNTELMFKIIYARTDTFKYSFSPRVVRSWSKLPIPVKKRDSVSEFKQELKLFCLQIDRQASD